MADMGGGRAWRPGPGEQRRPAAASPSTVPDRSDIPPGHDAWLTRQQQRRAERAELAKRCECGLRARHAARRRALGEAPPPGYDPGEWDETTAVYWVGYQQGRADHAAEMQAWAEEFANSAPGAAVVPLETRHAAVVRDLAERMTTGRWSR